MKCVEKLVCTEKDVTRHPEAFTGVSRTSVLLQSWTKFLRKVMQYILLTGNSKMTCQIMPQCATEKLAETKGLMLDLYVTCFTYYQ